MIQVLQWQLLLITIGSCMGLKQINCEVGCGHCRLSYRPCVVFSAVQLAALKWCSVKQCSFFKNLTLQGEHSTSALQNKQLGGRKPDDIITCEHHLHLACYNDPESTSSLAGRHVEAFSAFVCT